MPVVSCNGLFAFQDRLSLRGYLSEVAGLKIEERWRRMHEVKTMKWLIELSDVLAYLHSQELAHGDLTTE